MPTYGSVGRYFLPFVMNLAAIRPREVDSDDAKPPARTLLMGCDDGDFVFNLYVAAACLHAFLTLDG